MQAVQENAPLTLRFGGSPNDTSSIFGPLSDLIGTWVGTKGWNLVAVPQQHVKGFLLLVRPYVETIIITPLSTPTPNRGAEIIQQVPTLMYSLNIHDAINGSLLHAENGTWLLLHECPGGFSIARQASVPHGDSILALGSSLVTKGAPQIPDISTLPVTGPGAPLGYSDPYLTPLPGFNKVNPNATLREAIEGQTILESTSLTVSTANEGGLSNIPFITKNANATKFDATFWIETVLNEETNQTFLQLQYSQNTILEFLPRFDNPAEKIQWPHININTLVKQ
jgi:hypothetical protein